MVSVILQLDYFPLSLCKPESLGAFTHAPPISGEGGTPGSRYNTGESSGVQALKRDAAKSKSLLRHSLVASPCN